MNTAEDGCGLLVDFMAEAVEQQQGHHHVMVVSRIRRLNHRAELCYLFDVWQALSHHFEVFFPLLFVLSELLDFWLHLHQLATCLLQLEGRHFLDRPPEALADLVKLHLQHCVLGVEEEDHVCQEVVGPGLIVSCFRHCFNLVRSNLVFKGELRFTNVHEHSNFEFKLI